MTFQPTPHRTRHRLGFLHSAAAQCRGGIATAVLALLTGAVVSRAAEPQAQPATGSEEAVAALHALRNFATTGRVLHIGAHPDDENTQLIAYLSRGRGYDTAYLSITRGEGGQNILGPELGEKLGVARTQELLAARRIDGGRQFFTRAVDFGFSKNPGETLSIWNHHEVLADVVRVIRRFRPDVVVTRFPPPPGSGGHGHHTASAILAVEAFNLAGDPAAFPEQLAQGLEPWRPTRLVWNAGPGGDLRTAGVENKPTVKLDIAGTDPVTGESFGALAARSRSMHRTQGFAEFSGRASAGPRIETFVVLSGEPARADLMDGVDTSWARIPGGEELAKLAAAALSGFDRNHPEDSLPSLLAMRSLLAELKPDAVVADKRAQLDRAIFEGLGLRASVGAERAKAQPGQSLPVVASVAVAVRAKVTWTSVERGGVTTAVGADLNDTTPVTRVLEYLVPADARLTQPYWLRQPGTVGMNRVDDPQLIGLPVNGPSLPFVFTFAIEGQTFRLDSEVVRLESPGVAGAPSASSDVPVGVVAPVTLRFDGGPAMFRPGATLPISVHASAGQGISGSVRLEVPTGWRASPPQAFAGSAEPRTLTFDVTAPVSAGTGLIAARATVNGREWSTDLVTVEYPHIPQQRIQPPAQRKVVSAGIAMKAHSVGYISGAGDDIPDALGQLGCRVITLSGPGRTPLTLTDEALAGLDAVVIGVRAFNTRTDLAAGLPALFRYVENGGTVICQYNWARDLKVEAIAPYRLRLSADRVTDENAVVTFLAPDHPVLNTPNRIGPQDFEGWVQERGVYFPAEWGEQFVPILSMSDPGEAPLKGALLVARHGKGWFVYTSLALFRQLPAGVPGAYRLFANMLSLGKESAP